MKWFARKTFVLLVASILLSISVSIVSGQISISSSLAISKLSPQAKPCKPTSDDVHQHSSTLVSEHRDEPSSGSEDLDMSVPTSTATSTDFNNDIREEKLSSQLMPFFYVGDVDPSAKSPSSSSSASSSANIISKADRIKKIKKSKKSTTAQTQTQSPTLSDFVTRKSSQSLTGKIPVIIPLSSPSTSNIETRRVFNDNESPFALSNIDRKPRKPYKLLWYIPPSSSSSLQLASSPLSSLPPPPLPPLPSSLSSPVTSTLRPFPFTSSGDFDRSAFGSNYVPLFKYSSIAKPPSFNTGSNRAYYQSNYHPSPPSLYNHYSIFPPSPPPPSSLSYPSFRDFSTYNGNDEDDEDNEESVTESGFLYSTPFSSAPPSTFTSTNIFHAIGPSNHYFGKPYYGSPMRRKYPGKKSSSSPKPKTSTKDILQDPDIERLLTTFDLEREPIHKDKHYRPRKSYDDEIPMNGKYSEGGGNNNGRDGLRDKSFSSFDDMDFMLEPESNSGRYGVKSNFKPYFGYYEGFRISPHHGKGFTRPVNKRFKIENSASISMKQF